MKKFFMRIVFVMLLTGTIPFCANGKELTPVGQIVGLELRDGSVMVASFDEELGGECVSAGIQIGDEIRKICGIKDSISLVITLGYPTEGDPLRTKKRKPLDELVTML